mmetsp:Transcript_4845/g.9894  ORF Transcript_4845/g.9894 Transcript_4845/m.9894 type:complete len:127 (+) Transcript_4845:293-673(+)
MVLVGYEDVGAQEFLDEKFWAWNEDVFIDTPHDVFKALKANTAGLWTLAKPSVMFGMFQARRVKTNFEGGTKDPWLGGTYVVSGGRIVYEYRAQSFSDHPAGEEVLQACTQVVKGTGEMPVGQPSE